MLSQIIRITALLAVVLGVILCLRIPFLQRHKKLKLLFIPISIITFLAIAWPIENFFYSFSSPEKAFQYSKSGQILGIVDGEHSSFIQYKLKPYEYSRVILPKTETGWGINIFLSEIFLSQTVYNSYVQGVNVNVYHTIDTQDYYIEIWSENAIEIEDSQHSTFHCFSDKELAAATCNYFYYAYVKDMDQSYTLTVNGEEIHINSNSL